ncbi:MAG: CsbD family protein [Polyangiaceae bacterium]
MNRTQIEGKWMELKGQARTRWAKLTEEDLKLVEGEFDKLVGKVSERYGIAREQARAEVSAWADRQGERIEEAGRTAEKKIRSAGEALKGSGPR